jgi:hypothetical protein
MALKAKNSIYYYLFYILLFSLNYSCLPTYHKARISNFKTELNSKYENSPVSSPSHDHVDRQQELKAKMKFPEDSTDHAILYKCNFTGVRQKLTDDQLESILLILNDASSYAWGEIGTPKTEYYLVFYNQNNKCIGITEIDLSGQTYSGPYRSLMKQGFINQITFPRLKRILKIK